MPCRATQKPGEMRWESLHIQLLVWLQNPTPDCIHTNTEIHCCEEKQTSFSVLLITKRKERGEALFMVSTEILHYNDWCLYTWLYFVLTCKTEDRDKNLPQHLCKAGGEKQHSVLWKPNSQLCCPLTVARHHSMSCWRGVPFGSDANP